ncbi:MAG TPA: ABC transporter permease subunit [Thermoanaerobaculia bacterium]|jgi:hypothetical protein
MIRRFVRQKFGSPGLAAALAIFAIIEIFTFANGAGRGGFVIVHWAIFVLAAGSVSRDISSGALQMILSRPIRRTEYLFGRYLGILASYGLFLAVTSALIFFVVHLAGRSAAADTSPLSLVLLAADVFLTGAFQAAILLMFSTFLPGIADLLGLLVLFIVLNLPPWQKTWLRNAAEAARENILPTVSWNEALRGQGILGAATGRWVFALTVYLVLAALIFSRRELPYGQD